jgi:asparagine synthetase B (glutamine-hydrolysing)
MCGILGVLSLSGEPIDVSVLQRMSDLQSHRGPDGEGFLLGWLDGDKTEHVLVRQRSLIEITTYELPSDTAVWQS